MRQQQQGIYSQNVYSLDECETYFSHVLSPLRKNKNRHNHHQKQQPPTSHRVVSGHEFRKECCEGDVDCEAEAFIREKHKQLELSKTMSMISG